MGKSFLSKIFDIKSNTIETKVICEKCGGEMESDGLVYTSLPPKYKFICKECGNSFFTTDITGGRYSNNDINISH